MTDLGDTQPVRGARIKRNTPWRGGVRGESAALAAHCTADAQEDELRRGHEVAERRKH